MPAENEIPSGTPPVKVSVVVPVYNVEKYLRTCLDFIVAQTLREIEIICVNDGSTDGSLAILEEYAKEDARIKIISQENKGVSAARNSGLEAAQGKYILFFDPDDWFYSLTALEELYERAEKFSLDILRGRTICFDNISAKFFTDPWDSFSKFMPKGFCMDAFPPEAIAPFFGRMPRTIHAVLLRTDFLKRSKLRFPVEYLFCEDVLFFLKAALLARRIGFFDKPFYVYRRNRPGSVITDSYEKNWTDRISVYREICGFIAERECHPGIKKSILASCVNSLSWDFSRQKDIQRKEELSKILREHLPFIVSESLLENDDFRSSIVPRTNLFLEWIYSGETYAGFFQKRKWKTFRYAILCKITVGRRKIHYQNKVHAKF